MKILAISNIFPPHIRGGYEIGAWDILRRLQSRGHKVVIATSDNHLSTVRPNYDMKNLEGMDVRHIFLSVREYVPEFDLPMRAYPQYIHERNHRFGGYVEANCIALRQLIETENPDLIYFFNPLALGPVGLLDTALAFSGKKVLLHLMDNIDGVIRDHGESLGMIPKWERVMRFVHSLACSKKISADNQRNSSFASCTILYNSLDTTLWKEVVAQKRAENEFRLVYWGQVSERKGIAHIARAMKSFSERNPSCKISADIYGAAEKTEEAILMPLIERTGMREAMNFRGFVDQKQLRECLCNYDAGIFLLHEDEPFGYAPAESILTGLPTIFTKATGIGEAYGDELLLIKNRNDSKEVASIMEEVYKRTPTSLEAHRRMVEVTRKDLDIEAAFMPRLLRLIDSLPANKGYDVEGPLSIARGSRFPLNCTTIISMEYNRYLGYMLNRMAKRLTHRPKLSKALYYLTDFLGLKR
jgi:glycosyltransferase involved in cell wall biosynthesis